MNGVRLPVLVLIPGFLLGPSSSGCQERVDPGPGEAPAAGLVRVTGPTGLSVGLEGRWLHQSDDLVSALRYSGVSYGPSVRVGFSNPSMIRVLTFAYGAPELTSTETEFGLHRQKGYRMDLRLVGLKEVLTSGSGRLSLYLGGAVSGNFAFYRHRYTQEEHESWAHLFGLVHPAVGWSFRFPGGGHLWEELSAPMGGVVFRPAYEGMRETPRSEWVGPGEVEGFHHAVQYLHPLGRRVRLGVVVSFLGIRYARPRPLALTRQTLGVFLTVWGGGPGE